MKKTIAVLAAAMLLLGIAGAFAEPLMGGWRVAENTDLTEENRAVFDKAMEGLVGVNYVPVAYLGSQVVAGTNHCFLCKATVVYPGAEPALALVYVYEDLKGAASVTDVVRLDIAERTLTAE